MSETNEQPKGVDGQEAQVDSKIASKFQSARETVMKESAEISEIYKSITKPGAKDIYNSWVKNMDVVANSYSWGKDKTAFRTRMLLVTNRLVGGTAAILNRPLDLVVDAVTWLPRKFPVVGHFIPDHFFGQRTIKSAENAKKQALALRGARWVVQKAQEPAKLIDKVVVGGVAGAMKRTVYGSPIPEARAGWQYLGNKINNITEGILHPKAKV